MIVKGKDAIGLNVISINNGKLIGSVDDLIYDPIDQKIKAFILNKKGLFSDAKVILFDQIRTIGKDAVLIDTATIIKKPSEIPAPLEKIAKENTYLTRTKIVTEQGTALGEVSDLFFDSETGDVSEFEVSQGGLKDLHTGKKRVKVADIITIGEDATIVKGYTEEKFAQQQGGFQGAINQTRDRMNTSRDTMRTRYGDFTSEENQKRRREQFNTTQDKLQDIANQTIATLRQKVDEFQNHPRTKETQLRMKTKAIEAQQAVYSQVNKARDQRTIQRREDAVGRFVTKNVLLPNDEVLAKKGDMITHGMLDLAETNGILDQILNNTASDPLED